MRQLIRASRNKAVNRLYRLLFTIYTLFLFTVTLMPGSIISAGGKGWLTKITFGNADKLMHILLFFAFTLLLNLAFRTKRRVLLIVISILTGLLIEVLQEITGWGRTFEWADVLANTVGILLAFFLIVGNFIKT